ncbi:MAG TPA: GTPase Era [Vicinamibacteria bacterium]|nr:GTPase Era [Vicinamibacteria bacterium]
MRSGFITIVGRPNVGKSTLLNRIVGQKVAIVTAKPQTTRNRVLAIANLPGAQMVFFDTPGIHKPHHEMNRRMVEMALRSLKQVDVILLVCDVTEPLGPGDAYVLEQLRDIDTPVVLAINKIDRVARPRILPVIDSYRREHDFTDLVPCSALEGEGVDVLVDVLASHLAEGDPLYPPDALTDLPERFFVSEIVREKILESTRNEVPYAAAVLVDSWEEGNELTRIEATILVERASQRGILVGKGGAMLKHIGTAARKDIEAFLGTRVFLGLHVKVRADWRENRRLLSELGIDPRR